MRYLPRPIDLRHMEQFISFFITGVTILVVAVPEGLPLATGTLTTNRMEVVAIYVESNFIAPIKGKVSNKISKSVRKLLVDSIALNSSYTSMIVPSEIPGGPPSFMGNMTECALLGLAKELGADYKAIRSAVPDTSFTHVLTFNSDRKSMTTMVRSELVGYKPGHYVIHTKGASEIVLKHCERVLVADGNEEIISPETLASINKIISTMAANALRTIGLSFKILPDTADLEDDSATLESQTLIAICGIEDPVREEVPAAVAACQRAGITVRMLTGDNLNTAKSIATQCGILSSDESDVLAMEGTEFNKKIKDPDSGQVIQSQLDKIWPKLRVLARCLPEDKYNLVRGMRMAKPVGASRNREVVAVTGDGTNDAPALKMADVGFAMGITGTDVAKEASDIILMDDNFTSIVKAVMWGRTVFDNICKFLQFQLTVNLVALVISFTSACVLNDSPLRAVQMLWVNMVMDTLASVALSSENPSEDVLERLPVGSASNIVTKDMFSLIVGMAFYMLVVLLTVQYYGPKMFRMS
ncbi:unnamed protein product [Notodromas monacha]|uniref:Cation-transporting P-type ATPase C-terminal domain-containing protein n=1 Tax=Notodromas monacha TaxID=399045 RepID=A0A7R9GJX7_9CRUS|nr:unnamed protein product [Notodromas monacha]CAG0924145.1 unnamed protein product [Notodromas monacha]